MRTFLDRLNDIQDDLSKHHSGKEAVFASEVAQRLNQSLVEYQKELECSLRYLQRKDDLKVARAIRQKEKKQ